MPTTGKGFPYPVSGDGRPHIDQAMAAIADRVEAVVKSLSDAELALLAGTDLWDGEFRMQNTAGATRKWKGLYGYESGITTWDSLIPTGLWAPHTPTLTAVTTNPNAGTAATFEALYAEYGDQVYGRARVVIAGTGITAGSGAYLISLPVTANAAEAAGQACGRWVTSRASPSQIRHGTLRFQDSTHVKLSDGTGDVGSGDAFTTGSWLVVNYRYRKA